MRTSMHIITMRCWANIDHMRLPCWSSSGQISITLRHTNVHTWSQMREMLSWWTKRSPCSINIWHICQTRCIVLSIQSIIIWVLFEFASTILDRDDLIGHAIYSWAGLHCLWCNYWSIMKWERVLDQSYNHWSDISEAATLCIPSPWTPF